MKGWKKKKKNISSKQTGKKARVAILRHIDFKTKAIKRDPEGHFIILKERIPQEDINIINIYAPNTGAPKYIKKILEKFKKDIDRNTLTLRDFNTLLSKMDRSPKGNINNDIAILNSTLDQMDSTHIYRTFHLQELEEQQKSKSE